MKTTNKIYVPVRIDILGNKIFCLDRKGKPRMYKTLSNLILNMIEPYDLVIVYEATKELQPKFYGESKYGKF